MPDASTGLLRACECVERHAFRHDYIGDLPINDVAWFALLRRLGDTCCCLLQCAYMLKCSGIAHYYSDYIVIVSISAQSTYE